MNLPQAGELRELIDIVEVTAPFHSSGEGIVTAVIATGVWAKIEALGGGMDAETMQVRSCRQTYRIWIRKRSDITPFNQLVWRGQRLIIDGPTEPMEQWMLLHAYSVTEQGV